MASPSTKDRILDAAESLFAARGYEGTSLRAVTGEAGVNLAAVSYHLGGKLKLYQAVFQRRVEGVNRERLRLLDRAEERSAPDPAPLEALLFAFLAPALSPVRRRDAGWRRFLQIVGRANSESGEHVEAIQDVFREIEERFVPALIRALPELPPPVVLWRMHFVIGAMCAQMADPARIELISGGRCDGTDPDEAVAQLVAFAAGGLRAPAPSARRALA